MNERHYNKFCCGGNITITLISGDQLDLGPKCPLWYNWWHFLSLVTGVSSPSWGHGKAWGVGTACAMPVKKKSSNFKPSVFTAGILIIQTL